MAGLSSIWDSTQSDGSWPRMQSEEHSGDGKRKVRSIKETEREAGETEGKMARMQYQRSKGNRGQQC